MNRDPAATARRLKASKRPLRSGFYGPLVRQHGQEGNSSWWCYFDLGSVAAVSAVRQLGSVLALAAAAIAATDIGSAQQFDPSSRDIRTGVYQGQAVTYEVVDGLAIWDGDIILGTPEELSPEPAPTLGNPLDRRNKISTISIKERLWPSGIIPYVIDPDLENPNVPDAIRHWEENTSIRFVERTDQPNWVRFVPDGACRSYVGMIGGEQNVFLSEFCSTSDVVHEIGHVVGLWHEHQRNDRDAHVWIRSNSLGIANRFYVKDGPYAVASGPYDYGSVMHYRWIGPLVTIPPAIVLRHGGPHLGGAVSPNAGLSAGDIDGVNRLYGTIPTQTTVSANIAGLLIEVDGETYSSPHSFDWEPGSVHTIGVPAPQRRSGETYAIGSGNSYLRYLFANWSDGGAQTHSVTASPENTVFIANFIEQIRPGPSAHPPYAGTVRFDPPPADWFFPRLSLVKVIAEPAEGFSFQRWRPRFGGFAPIEGGLSSNPMLSRVNQFFPAVFTRQTLSKVDTNAPGSVVLVDGSPTILPDSFAWEAGSTHTLGFSEHVGTTQFTIYTPYRLIFNGWSDGGDATHDITVSEEPPTITANFTRQVSVRTVSHGSGRIEVQPSGSEGRYHDLSTTAQLTARPDLGSKFVSWQGDLSGTENPQSMLLDSHKLVRAFFLDEHAFDSAKLTSGKPFNLLFGPGSARTEGYNGYWIDVPRGATQLDIRLVTTTQGAEVDLYASRDIRPSAMFDENTNELVGYESLYSSTGPGGNETITITPASSPPLRPGPYFIAVHVRTQGVRVRRTLTASLTVSEAEIAAEVPAFGIPASLITTIEGEIPAPQILEIRNSSRGTLNYQIATNQPWLSVRPDQGSSAGETDSVEITVDPANLEPGTFEGATTITERPPAGGFYDLFSKSTPPAWPVTVPVTLIVIPESLKAPPPAFSAFTEDGRPAIEARLYAPNDVALDAAGNLYIADTGNFHIRRVDPSGIISVIAGIGEEGYTGDGGAAIDARLQYPAGVTVDAVGNLFFSESFESRIRRVDPSGIITTIAGTGEKGYAGDGGPAVEAQLSFPSGLAVDAAGNLFIADTGNHRIRKVDTSGVITTVAGTGIYEPGVGGFDGDGGPAVAAQLGVPTGVAVDAAGNLFIAVITYSNIRRVDPSGNITTIAGVGRWGFSGDGGPAVEAHLSGPGDLALDAAGNLFIADSGNNRIRRVDSSGIITTIAGTGVRGFSGDGGPAVAAQLDDPRGVAVDAAGNLFIADHDNHRIRKVDPSGTITTIAGTEEL